MNRHPILISAAVSTAAAALITVGCHRKAQTAMVAGPTTNLASTTLAATAPATDASSHFAKFGIQIEYPAAWTAKADKDLELLLVNGSEPGAAISLDVPDLPPHIPGMIPIGLVKSGYLDDLRKELTGTPIDTREASPDFPGAKARAATSTWIKDGSCWTESALVLVRGDKVYILRARYLMSQSKVKAAFDQIIDGIKW